MTTIPAVSPKEPLPQNPFHLHDQLDLHAAYDQCLASEHEAESEQALIYARCLGYLLIELPMTRGQRMVAEDIILCNGNKDAMNCLAELYINHIIHLCESIPSSILISLDACVQSDRTKELPRSPRITTVGHHPMIIVFITPPGLSQCLKITELQNVL